MTTDELVRWVVSTEVIVNRYIEARTEEEAMAICARQYDGEPYDAMPLHPSRKEER